MIRTLSYFNLVFAVIYFLQYLQNGSFFAISGLLMVVIFNWMVLRGIEKGQLGWSAMQWAAGILNLGFGGLTGYSAAVLLLDAVEYQYYPAAAVVQIAAGFLFAAAILLHFIRALRNKY